MLAVGLLAVSVGVYYVNSTGFWAAAKNPPEYITGTVVKIWQPAAREDPTYITMIKANIDGGRTIQLSGRSKLIFDCSTGDEIEILKYTTDDGKSFFRVGPQACYK